MRFLGYWICAMVLCFVPAMGETISLHITRAPASGMVIAPVDLTGMNFGPADAAGGTLAVKAFLQEDHSAIPAQFVPEEPFQAAVHAVGSMVLQLPRSGDFSVELEAVWTPFEALPATGELIGKEYGVEFGKPGAGPFPSKMVFARSQKTFESPVWNDRLYDDDTHEQFWMRYDAQASVRIVSSGELCTVVRGKAHYCRPDGTSAASRPRAEYDWYFFKHLPAVYVTAALRQDTDFFWDEMHFLELSCPDKSFPEWMGAAPAQKAAFSNAKTSHDCSEWAAFLDGPNVLGLFGGNTRVYDGFGDYGVYLNAAWRSFRGTELALKSHLWIGYAEDPPAALATAITEAKTGTRVTIHRPELEQKVAALCAEAEKSGPDALRQAQWRRSIADALSNQGQLNDAMELAAGKTPPALSQVIAGDLGVALWALPQGIRVQSLFDLQTGKELASADRVPLFEASIRSVGTEDRAVVTADGGWNKVTVDTSAGITVRLENAADTRCGGMSVTLSGTSIPDQSGLQWHIAVENVPTEWAIQSVRFPQLALTRQGDATTALIPIGPGELKPNVCSTSVSYSGRYPSGWCSMPLLAVYDEGNRAGLYCGVHDAWGSTKEISLESDPATETVRLAYEEPVPGMGVSPSAYASPGDSIWQLFRGDWFDVAMIYKQWARANAKWWPALGTDGREDTPLWMRELSVWALSGGTSAECVPGVKQFQQYLGVPAGVHWYTWHENPFDNDYPHYFPARSGFAEGVADLQQNNVFVMPYINGRLWDTRDKGAEDFQFTSVALPAVSKEADGKPFTETYGSKESDGSPVRLGVMCPATSLWQQTVKDIVLRLHNECGVKGVYIDQIAAAWPVLCMDKSHGHPLGGGHWWNEGYWQMLDRIRQEKQADRMLTTECNAEPFIRWMDGYLTWHWQYDGMVPVFPAIYGGTVQMFGRSYGGGDTKDLALRMRAAQQLVFGEQLGWINPGMLAESESKDFFRQAVQLRHRFRRYFYAGQMARPPRCVGEMPQVKADWQWNGVLWVTTDAVLSGAWQLPGENKQVFFFANVSDESRTLEASIDDAGYLPVSAETVVKTYRAEGIGESFMLPENRRAPLAVPARTVVAWEIE